MNPEIIIDGSAAGTRYRVVIDGHEVFLQGAAFRLMAILAIAKSVPQDPSVGWVGNYLLYSDYGRTAKEAHRVRKQVWGQLPDRYRHWRVIENDGQGSVRLISGRATIKNPQALIDFGDATIVEVMKGYGVI